MTILRRPLDSCLAQCLVSPRCFPVTLLCRPSGAGEWRRRRRRILPRRSLASRIHWCSLLLARCCCFPVPVPVDWTVCMSTYLCCRCLSVATPGACVLPACCVCRLVSACCVLVLPGCCLRSCAVPPSLGSPPVLPCCGSRALLPCCASVLCSCAHSCCAVPRVVLCCGVVMCFTLHASHFFQLVNWSPCCAVNSRTSTRTRTNIRVPICTSTMSTLKYGCLTLGGKH